MSREPSEEGHLYYYVHHTSKVITTTQTQYQAIITWYHFNLQDVDTSNYSSPLDSNYDESLQN